jgi:hypothetical protein
MLVPDTARELLGRVSAGMDDLLFSERDAAVVESTVRGRGGVEATRSCGALVLERLVAILLVAVGGRNCCGCEVVRRRGAGSDDEEAEAEAEEEVVDSDWVALEWAVEREGGSAGRIAGVLENGKFLAHARRREREEALDETAGDEVACRLALGGKTSEYAE